MARIGRAVLCVAAAAAWLAAAGAARLKCRSSPGAQGNLLAAYDDGDVVDLECQTRGEAVGGSAAWHRTLDGCYVPGRFVAVDGGAEPDCAAVPCRSVAAAALGIAKRYEPLALALPLAVAAGGGPGAARIGYGHLCASPGCADVGARLPATARQAHTLLLRDFAAATRCLGAALTPAVALNENQWAALASWAVNVGCPAAAESQLVARLNRGELPPVAAALELPRWVSSNGTRRADLAARRADELALFFTASPRQAHPRCMVPLS
ncbi:hypothetical protein H4R18_003897 [Coemansia javaensis]|uniref:Lysozyme n=1 Tax=Coemansia javaensis TaxID=2761396 RepID=A0A9W8H966_9FUNG|nr:hypothetical protein H4R18_003897 [Coemansia javaensis]